MEIVLLKTILFEALRNRGFFSSSLCCYRELNGSEYEKLTKVIAEAVAVFENEEKAVENYDALYDWARYECEI